jgi:cytidylate kinase
MLTRQNHLTGLRLGTAEKVLTSALHVWTREQENSAEGAIRSSVTVSRQPGAGGNTLSHRLAARLNQENEQDWSAWDRELIDKVAAEHNLSKELIEMIPTRRHNWLDDMLQGLFSSQTPPEIAEVRAYKKVMLTIRALASAGHAILVGYGGQFITQGMPGAIHLRLVAPIAHRLRHTVEREQITLKEAAERIHEIDQHRTAFYHRYWPHHSRESESFTMTLNVAELSVDEMIECVVPVIRSRESAPLKASVIKPVAIETASGSNK